MALGNGYAAYKEVRVSTATQSNLLLMLYDGLVTQLDAAVKALQNKAGEEAHKRLVKAQDIISELTQALNMDYEISQNLHALYTYCYERLVSANVAKDPQPAIEVLGLMTELREAWQQAMRSQQGAQAAAGGQPDQGAFAGSASSAGGMSRLEITG